MRIESEFTEATVVENETNNVVPLFPEVQKPRAVRRREKCAKKIKEKKYNTASLVQDGLTALIDSYLNKGRKTKHGYFQIQGSKIIHIAPACQGEPEYTTIIAMKVNGTLIGNSSILRNVNRTNAYGSLQSNNSETAIQQRLATLIPMLPFVVFEEAKLDLRKCEIIDQGASETITRKFLRLETRYEVNMAPYSRGRRQKITEWKSGVETVHFTGASLFKVQGKMFLFDIDRREITHQIFNPFLVQIPKKASSIDEAYAVLKPKAVYTAEKAGLKVERQGEWFFIPVDKKTEAKVKKMSRKYGGEVALRVGNNRPNKCNAVQFNNRRAIPNIEKATNKIKDWNTRSDLRDKLNSEREKMKLETFIYGTVKHSGREHADLKLKRVCRAIPNTAFRSFTITGDVD